MDHKAFLAIALLMGTSFTHAQDADSGVRLGVKVAPNTHWLRPDSKGLESDGNSVGYSFGVVVDVPFGAAGTYAFHTGLGMMNLGGKLKASYTENNLDINSTQDTKLRYIDVPLCLKLRTRTEAPMDFYGLLGTSAAFNIRARSDFSTTVGGTTTSDTDVDIIEDVALFKMGLVVGAGVEYKIGSGATIFGGITYNNAFTNVLQGDSKFLINPDKKSKLYADYLELTVGVFL